MEVARRTGERITITTCKEEWQDVQKQFADFEVNLSNINRCNHFLSIYQILKCLLSHAGETQVI